MRWTNGYKPAGFALLLCVLAACAPLPQRTSLAVEQRPSPNYNERRPNYVVLHYTSNSSVDPALRTLTSRFSGVSAHYLIGRDGKLYYLVDETQRAWHAGDSYWGGNRDLNSASIGIEIDNAGDEPYPDGQVSKLLDLLADLRNRYGIPAANFIGHSDVAPRRKVDPGRYFPWRQLAAQGFGLWCDPPYAPAPAGADDALLLAAFGYDTADLPAAISAFKLHFAPDGDPGLMTEADRGMLYCLVGRRP